MDDCTLENSIHNDNVFLSGGLPLPALVS